jgi:hypothetical protein
MRCDTTVAASSHDHRREDPALYAGPDLYRVSPTPSDTRHNRVAEHLLVGKDGRGDSADTIGSTIASISTTLPSVTVKPNGEGPSTHGDDRSSDAVHHAG